MIPESDPKTVLYASISTGSIVLADLLPSGDDSSAVSGGAGDLSALAAICLDAAPRFHLLYTHTSSRRIYAFIMDEPLLYFAIADESLGRSAALLFLHRLRDATVHIARRRIGIGDPLSNHCLQDELFPVISGFASRLDSRSEEEDKPYPLPPPALPSPPPRTTPPSSDSHLLTGEHKRKKVKKERKKNPRSEAGAGCSHGRDELEISVMDDDAGANHVLGLGAQKSVHRIWVQQVRLVLVIDLMLCSLLFGIWLSVCKGFQCISE